MIYYEPVNIHHWNIFHYEVGHVENFVGTKAMQKGDIVLFYVGKNDFGYVQGVYGVGKIVKDPYINTIDPEAICYLKTTVDIEIVYINRGYPFIPYEICKTFITPPNCVHAIKYEYVDLIESYLKNIKSLAK